MSNSTSSSWQPVLPSHELRAAENIVAGFLHGQEIAFWRSRDGIAQAWENRCPHRGTRLTLGRILAGRLSCAYHGWEFEAGSGACAVIPAQPQAPVPQGVCVKTYRAAEALGMVWVSIGQGEAATQEPPTAMPAQGRFLRSLSVRAGPAAAAQVLAGQGFSESEPSVWQGRLAERDVTLLFTPAQADWIFLHLFAAAQPAGLNETLAASRRLRAEIEGAAA